MPSLWNSVRMIRIALLPLTALSVLCLSLSACSAREPQPDDTNSINDAVEAPAVPAAADSAAPEGPSAFEQRLAAIEAAIGAWIEAPDIATAHRAAETARNLVVGPAGPYYGDSDRDGTVSGASDIGFLPGRDGEAGIARADMNACVARDVLGGDWSDPRERWAILDRAIKAWSPTNNPFPTLPSHLQRIVGWASLTLASRDVAKAREFASHARLHSDVSRKALESCG